MVDQRPTTPRRPATDAEAKALASPLRLRILRICLDEAHTNKEIAQRLGKDPATTLHHVRTLIDTGFLAVMDERRGSRGAREVPYRATGKSWTLENPAVARPLLDTFIEEAGAVPAEQLDVIRLGLRLTAEDKRALMAQLLAVLEEFRWKEPADGAGAWSTFVAVHPDPNRPPG